MKALVRAICALFVLTFLALPCSAQDLTSLEVRHSRGETFVEIPGPPPVSVKVEEVKGKEYRKTKRDYGQSDRNHRGKTVKWSLGECGEGKVTKKSSREYHKGSACINGVNYVCLVFEKITEKSVGGEVCSTDYELRIDCYIGDECVSGGVS